MRQINMYYHLDKLMQSEKNNPFEFNSKNIFILQAQGFIALEVLRTTYNQRKLTLQEIVIDNNTTNFYLVLEITYKQITKPQCWHQRINVTTFENIFTGWPFWKQRMAKMQLGYKIFIEIKPVIFMGGKICTWNFGISLTAMLNPKI